MAKAAINHIDNYKLEDVKETLRKCLTDIGMPRDNPFSEIINPGDTVFIKPNWVASRWRASCPHKDSLYCVITHPSVIEATADFAAEALKGEGEIIIGDNPSIDADFDELMEFTGIRERLTGKYGCSLKIKDLRPLICDDLKNYGKKDLMVPQPGDDTGTVKINLGKDSSLYGIDSTLFRGVFDEREDTIAAHSGETQLYTFAKSLYDADVYISIPKLKTHQKVGATLNLKGLVGAVTDKNQLVHWRLGYPEIGGDEYASKDAYEEGKKQSITYRGGWFGNDTTWRMVTDLYKSMKLKERKYLSIIDGIIAGEGRGPFWPTSKYANTLIVSDDLLAADCVGVRYMGFNPEKIKYIQYFLESGSDINLSDIIVKHNGNIAENFFSKDAKYSDFEVIDSWKCAKC